MVMCCTLAGAGRMMRREHARRIATITLFQFYQVFLYNFNRIVIVISATVPRKRGGGEVDIVSIHPDRYSAVATISEFEVTIRT